MRTLILLTGHFEFVSAFRATDPKDLYDDLHLKVVLLNKADHRPVIKPNNFAVTVKENAPVDTLLKLVTVTDSDLPPWGDPVAYINPEDANSANDFLYMHQLLDKDLWELRVQSPWDIETVKTNPISVKIIAKDNAAVTGTADVEVRFLTLCM